MLQQAAGLIHRKPVRHLCPTGNPWSHTMTVLKKRFFIREIWGEIRGFGAWSDQAHVSLEHVPEFRKLVDPGGGPIMCWWSVRFGVAFGLTTPDR